MQLNEMGPFVGLIYDPQKVLDVGVFLSQPYDSYG